MNRFLLLSLFSLSVDMYLSWCLLHSGGLLPGPALTFYPSQSLAASLIPPHITSRLLLPGSYPPSFSRSTELHCWDHYTLWRVAGPPCYQHTCCGCDPLPFLCVCVCVCLVCLSWYTIQLRRQWGQEIIQCDCERAAVDLSLLWSNMI